MTAAAHSLSHSLAPHPVPPSPQSHFAVSTQYAANRIERRLLAVDCHHAPVLYSSSSSPCFVVAFISSRDRPPLSHTPPIDNAVRRYHDRFGDVVRIKVVPFRLFKRNNNILTVLSRLPPIIAINPSPPRVRSCKCL